VGDDTVILAKEGLPVDIILLFQANNEAELSERTNKE